MVRKTSSYVVLSFFVSESVWFTHVSEQSTVKLRNYV